MNLYWLSLDLKTSFSKEESCFCGGIKTAIKTSFTEIAIFSSLT